jgi:hypothetical protein
VQFSFEESFKTKIFNMMQQVQEIVKEGGADSVNKGVINSEMEENIETKTEETPIDPVFENQEITETENEEETSVNTEEQTEEQQTEENNILEDEPAQYNLDEIQEYIDLKSDYENLQAKFDAMKAEYDELVEFRNATNREEKQRMIDSFYMLSDADKKNVVDNIDNYTVEQIEEKLSVICVRNKVSFDLDDEDKSKENITTIFSLENDGIVDDTTPAWIKAIIDTKKEME